MALPGTAAPAAIEVLLTAARPVCRRAGQLGTTPQALAGLPTLAPGLYLVRVATPPALPPSA